MREKSISDFAIYEMIYYLKKAICFIKLAIN